MKALIRDFFILIVFFFLLGFSIKGCVDITMKQDVNYRKAVEVCKSKCLPKPYDPRYIPEQCVCMEGEAK